MRNSIGLIIFCSIFLGVAALCRAEQVEDAPPSIQVKTTIDKKTVTIGEKIRYTATFAAPKDIEADFSDLGKVLGNFTIKDFGSKKNIILGKQKITHWYVVTTYTTGTLDIPKAQIRYRKTNEKEWSQIETNEHTIEVTSLIDSSQGTTAHTEIIDIKNPVALPSKRKNLIIALLSLAFIGISCVFLFAARRKKTPHFTPRPPAHEIAYAQLEALQRKGYLTQGKIKEYYSEVSDIIRHYLENRFNLKAPEMTTEEFLFLARESAQLQSQQKALLREFLTACDLVKFAKYAPASEEIASVFESAKRFVEQTAYVLP